MKKQIILFVFLLGNIAFSQQNLEAKNVFVRVYDMKGVKIAKGVVKSWSEEGLVLQKRKNTMNVPFNNIGKIKFKRAGGHHIGIGALFGATVGGVFGLTSDDGLWISQGENSAAFAIVGAMLGSAFGGVSAVLKQNKTLIINGDIKNWEQQVNDHLDSQQ